MSHLSLPRFFVLSFVPCQRENGSCTQKGGDSVWRLGPRAANLDAVFYFLFSRLVLPFGQVLSTVVECLRVPASQECCLRPVLESSVDLVLCLC